MAVKMSDVIASACAINIRRGTVHACVSGRAFARRIARKPQPLRFPTTCLACVTSPGRPWVAHVKHALALFVELACSKYPACVESQRLHRPARHPRRHKVDAYPSQTRTSHVIVQAEASSMQPLHVICCTHTSVRCCIARTSSLLFRTAAPHSWDQEGANLRDGRSSGATALSAPAR